MYTFDRKFVALAFLMLDFAATGCGGSTNESENENEVITTVSLSFTPSAGGTPILASFNDADGDGGNPPVVTPVMLSAGNYDVAVKFENRLAMPAQDISLEIKDESDQHQIFFTGTAVNGPASNQPAAPLTQAYADMDANGLPVGLQSKITAAPGTGMLTITLRHMPPLNNVKVKVTGLADSVRAAMGFTTIGGSTDVQVTLPVTVQ